jgi:hypothetical protein
MAEKKDNDTVASDTVNAYRAQQAKAKTPAKAKTTYDDNKESVDNDMLAGEMAHPSGKKAGGSCKGYAKGGSASSRGDGCATKGHTRGAMR